MMSHRSRAQATAASLGAQGVEHRFIEKAVLLTGDASALQTANGAEMARCALQLLMRISSNIRIAMPPGFEALAADLAADGARFAWDIEPEFVPYDDDMAGYDAILSIGGNVRNGLPWTAITANP